MCFDADARPPLPPIRGAGIDSRDVILTSADGTQFAGFGARPEQPSGAGVVIIPDVRGLHPYYEELALGFAEAGVHAVAVDLFGRTAGAEKRRADFSYEEHVRQTRPESVDADIAAAAAYLRTDAGGNPERVYTLGFCFGGRVSFLQAAAGLGLAGVVGFYGWPTGSHRTGSPAPADKAQDFGCAVLAIFGGADQGIGPDARAEFDRALDAAGVSHTTVVYDGAPHSFFDRKQAEFAEASADAWRQVLDFMGRPQRPV
ncbi:MAG: dienelactone hydrolase family protein [Chloroflexota bacterium]|nr:dienelactone hydrolase family protein [Chloroflexota bacterium]